MAGIRVVPNIPRCRGMPPPPVPRLPRFPDFDALYASKERRPAVAVEEAVAYTDWGVSTGVTGTYTGYPFLLAVHPFQFRGFSRMYVRRRWRWSAVLTMRS